MSIGDNKMTSVKKVLSHAENLKASKFKAIKEIHFKDKEGDHYKVVVTTKSGWVSTVIAVPCSTTTEEKIIAEKILRAGTNAEKDGKTVVPYHGR
jgi:hypothetical protein